MSTVAPPELNRLYVLIDPYLNTEKRGGIVNPRSPGYHTSLEDLRAQGRANDYSAQCPADRRGRPADAAGVDITFGSLAELVLVHKRLRAACTPNAVGAYDPRIECLREFIGTLDGKVVSGYNRVATGSGTRSRVGWDAAGFGDDSHLWHEHLSVLRDRVRNANDVAGLAEVICGLPAGKLGWQPKDGQEVPPPVVVTPEPPAEHPVPTSGELYLDKVAAGVTDSDTVAYVQLLLAKVLRITLARTGDYDAATIAAAKRYQADVLGDAPKYCDGILCELQLLELIDRAGSTVKLYRSSATGGLITKAAAPPVVKPPTPKPPAKPGKVTLRLKDWKGSPAGRTLIQGMAWDGVNRCWWIWQADTVAGRKQQTVVIRRHREDGTYVGYITLPDAGHGSSIGVEPFAGGARFYVGHATKGAGYVTYRIGDSSTIFTPTPKLPNGDITVSPAADLLCVRVKDRFRAYDLSDARQGQATLRWDVRVPYWMDRFQGHLITPDGELAIHRDVATKGASELRVYSITGKGAAATAKRVQTVDTNPYGDEAEGAMVKDGWLFSVSRTGGDTPNRTVDATPVRAI